MIDTVALQLYTVRDETARDFQQALYKVAEIGYPGVEFAGYGNLIATEMKDLLHKTNLRAVGSHVSLKALEEDLAGQINYCHEIGCSLLVVPWLPETLHTKAGFQHLATQLNAYGRVCKEASITLAYHNHDFEFQPEGDGILFDHLLDNTDPELVKLEIDSYWVTFAGLDATTFIHKQTGRVASVHLKDMTPERTFTEVGSGTLPISDFIEAGQEAGATIFVVENDQPQIPSLESARRSFESLHRSLT